MRSVKFIVILVLLCSVSLGKVPPFQTKWIEQRLDHFNFEVNTVDGQPATYQQRLLWNDQYWGTNKEFSGKGCRGPIFFYTGNESPITDYWPASGLFTEVIAPKLGGLLIFAEHRYFGQSIPFADSNPWSPSHIGFCSADQALADYAQVIKFVKETVDGAATCPVFAFGGSYGGMLTTFFRIKYPGSIMGGLAASAPFNFVGSGISPFAFTEATTYTYEDSYPGCSGVIKKGINELMGLTSTPAGRQTLAQNFRLCNASLPTSDDALAVVNWFTGGLQTMAMLDYPYDTDYGIQLPGWPVNKTCEVIMKSKAPTLALRMVEGIGVMYNNTGDHKCYDINKDQPDFGVCCGWNYLACTEMYQPFASNGMFPYSPYNVTYDIASCQAQFGVTLDPAWTQTHFGGFAAIKYTSNLIFSNGLLDPWHTSGVLKSISDNLVAIVIPEAAHHLDLRGPNDADPVYVREARKIEEHYVTKWLADFFQKMKEEETQ